MPFFLLIVAAILFLAAWRNKVGDLGNLLATDVPPFLKWALALAAVGALGFAAPLKEVSRYLLALILVVIVVKNYTALFQGFTTLTSTADAGSAAPAASPLGAYALNPQQSGVTLGGLTGTGSTDAGGGGSLPDQPQTASPAANSGEPATGFNAAAWLAPFEAGFGGHA